MTIIICQDKFPNKKWLEWIEWVDDVRPVPDGQRIIEFWKRREFRCGCRRGQLSLSDLIRSDQFEFQLSLGLNRQRSSLWPEWWSGPRDKRDCISANFSHRDLILFFWHQLRVKIRCNRKCLDRIIFDKRRVNAACLVVRNGATVKSSIPSLPAFSDDGLGPSGHHPRSVNFVLLSS